jgi:hypothetical protein
MTDQLEQTRRLAIVVRMPNGPLGLIGLSNGHHGLADAR